MAYTVGCAFNAFRTGIVDLDADVTKTGRASRDYLVDQIKAIAKSNTSFPSTTTTDSSNSYEEPLLC